ncbi:hypothetical protein QJS10_CPA08g01499 [Acorus calamus]|uniref:Transcription initiation factor TFIID subunit 12 domain-containing protein n=1 Tax=Acorus calamus TaxID=4465 RepID=A0AAV9E8W4_ACOCL|nr:hypothetical protein QJS10_CPA08g01499 [Acorus calamus]
MDPPENKPPSEPPPQTAETPSHPPPQPSPPPPSAAPTTPEVPPPAPTPSQPNPSQAHPHHHQQQQPTPLHQQTLQNPNARPPSRPPYPHFSQNPPSPTQRAAGGLAIGVPAHHRPAQPQPPPTSSSSPSIPSFGPSPFSGPGRGPVTLQESNAQGRQAIQGYQNIGMIGSLSTPSSMWQSGIGGHSQQRAGLQPSRSMPPPSSQSLAGQKFQSPGMVRLSSIGSPSPGMPHGSQAFQPPRMPSSLGKPTQGTSLSSPSFRMPTQTIQQRSHLPQTQHHMPSSPQLHQRQQSVSQSHQSQEHHGQQFPPPRAQQATSHQQPAFRMPGNLSQKSLAPVTAQPSMVQSAPQTLAGTDDEAEFGNHILGKRSIHDLVAQVDPSEKLEPEVEDVLVEIADDFVASITTFACSLAKHRKSTMLEAKDVLLHLERNWNMTLPGFGGDEIKTFKKPTVNDVHKERLTVIKKSIGGATEAGNPKRDTAQVTGNPKANLARANVT